MEKLIMTSSKVSNELFGHGNCLLCGSRNPLSLGLRFEERESGVLHAEFQGNPALQGYSGILHGGVISSLLDSAMTHSLFHRGIKALTGELTVRFFRSVPCDALLNIRSWVKTSTPPLFYVEAELSWAGELMAMAKAKFMKSDI
ncbi:MAG: PaaI family thioesterase [Vulcanimicrobiota bacterium]